MTNRMKLFCSWDTRVGRFYIGQDRNGFHPMHDDDSLGRYRTAQKAVEDLAHGHTFSIHTGDDTADLGIPDDIDEWNSADE